MSDAPQQPPARDRREFLRRCFGSAAGIVLCGTTGAAFRGGLQGRESVWQIDPEACVQCGKCATECVLPVSAVKCFHKHAMCGYCNLCFGYFDPEAPGLDSGGENQICPTGAIQRRFVGEPYFEYTVDEDLCIGCGLCVKGCTDFGNGSLFLQVNHDLCVDCEECSIARACPTSAFRRVSADSPYMRTGSGEQGS